MNLEQIRNPHLIYPGQVLFLEKADGRARLRVGQPVESGPDKTTRLSPRVRAGALGSALASVPLSLIEPFMNEAVIFESDELQMAPRIVATPEGSVLLSRGELAYARGELGPQREYRIFREARPLTDPTSGELLGFEASFVGTADYTRPAETRTLADGTAQIVPATLLVTSVRQEAGVGDRLSPVPPREFTNYVPHAPKQPMSGQIVSIYGDGLNAGQSQIVALNRGAVDGVEPGHVLALWRAGNVAVDRTDAARPLMQLPDERQGTLFVFRVFKRMSYALIVRATDPVKRGDRFSEP
jgi:hypothetical protein